MMKGLSLKLRFTNFLVGVLLSSYISLIIMVTLVNSSSSTSAETIISENSGISLTPIFIPLRKIDGGPLRGHRSMGKGKWVANNSGRSGGSSSRSNRRPQRTPTSSVELPNNNNNNPPPPDLLSDQDNNNSIEQLNDRDQFVGEDHESLGNEGNLSNNDDTIIHAGGGSGGDDKSDRFGIFSPPAPPSQKDLQNRLKILDNAVVGINPGASPQGHFSGSGNVASGPIGIVGQTLGLGGGGWGQGWGWGGWNPYNPYYPGQSWSQPPPSPPQPPPGPGPGPQPPYYSGKVVCYYCTVNT